MHMRYMRYAPAYRILAHTARNNIETEISKDASSLSNHGHVSVPQDLNDIAKK